VNFVNRTFQAEDKHRTIIEYSYKSEDDAKKRTHKRMGKECKATFFIHHDPVKFPLKARWIVYTV
jgi:sulfur transfer protein SufE